MNYVNLYFTVSNPKASVEFYEKALGLEKRNAMPGPDGNYMHVEMAWHGQAVMFGPADPRSPQKTPKELGGTPFNFYLYCEDVDALTARARAAGAKVLIEPSDQFWGDRMSQIVDPDGYYWTLATHVRDIDFSKMTPPEHADDRKDGEAGASGTGAGNGDTTNAE
ncbi:MAG: VOC family protein [Deltaproteobacteria bacterium]|nr:VOC family protein [Deltaproteobacteria bacterium]